MQSKMFVSVMLLVLLCSWFDTSQVLATSYGRYALLIFGGQKTQSLESGPTYPADSLFVEHEVAPMFDVLLNDYQFSNADIYVHCLSGSKDSMEYDYFTDEVTNYHPATESSLKQSFHTLNASIDSNDSSLVFIYMCGHRRGVAQGDTLHTYGLYTSIVDDVDFSDWVKQDLLTYNGNNVNDSTKIVFIGGFCNAYGFWDDRIAAEMKDVCNHISFAAADDGLGFGDTIDGDPDHSFMKYWKDAVEDTVGITIQRAYVNAETDRLADEACVDDDPIRVYKATNWDTSFTLFGRELSSVTITGPVELGFKDYGTWYANWDAWPCGTFSYQWWKKLNGHQNWQTLGTDSSETERMWKTGFTLKVRVTRGDFYVEDTHLVLNDQESASKPKGPGEANKELAPEFIKPKKFALYPNYPNPFNPETTIRYDLPESAEVMIEIYDVSGRRLKTLVQEQKKTGRYEAVWDGLTNRGIQAPSGMYVYQIRAGDFVQRKKMLLLR